MRSLCAVALFVLAITECLGAQSDRSRQRSSPIRSVPVAADIKRDVDFDCPEEFGYYPHPSDCTLYYVCVFGGALLESCTGGLMYSHELQTCDWPRNVGCDGTSAIGAEDLERISEREPPPPPPRRTPPPPPPPRAQPNPVVTSRGQPKFSRDEYEKQQQLYAEVDDLPPVEEIESDRQQRVNRGQPSTIGQVQKDRDGYISQPAISGRTLNSNIIPASIPQNNGKIGSFSFGTQVDERRSSVVTQVPQAYSEDKSDDVTDYLHDKQLDNETNEINDDDTIIKTHVRRKRDVSEKTFGAEDKNSTSVDKMSKRSDHDEEIEFSLHSVDDDDDDNERGKRQVRYYVKNGYSKPPKNWVIAKPIKLVNIPQYGYSNQNNQGTRYSSNYNGLNGNQFYDSNQSPYADENSYTPLQADSYRFDGESQRPFKPSLPDPSNPKYIHNAASAATQIITKSPPISSLNNNNNPFASLAGGFYNNAPKQTQFKNIAPTNRPNYQVLFKDSSQLPSTVVTAKPVIIGSSTRPNEELKSKLENKHIQNQESYRKEKTNQKQVSSRPPLKEEDYKDRDNSSEYDDVDESSEESSREENGKDDDFKHDFPEPPYEFTHPKYKYSDIENPFANPNFDFDEFLAKLSDGEYSPSTTQKYKNVQMAAIRATNSPVKSTTASPSNSVYYTSTLNYKGMSSPKPFTGPYGPGSSANLEEILYTDHPTQSGQWFQIPQTGQKTYIQQQEKHKQNVQILQTQTTGRTLEGVKSEQNHSNLKDQRHSAINQNFERLTASSPLYDDIKNKGNHQRIVSISQNPFAVTTGAPIIFSTPKQQYLVKPEKIISLQPHIIATGKPYLISTVKPHNAYTAFKHSTAKPLTTIANQQLTALQNYWLNLSTESQFSAQSTPRPNSVSDNPKFLNYLTQTRKPFAKESLTTTTAAPKRRPIPKPSPEMNDYYYDDDEQFYYEPPVKSKYMPSSEVRPSRPPMAQNYKEYDDNYSYEEIQEHPAKPLQSSRAPTAFTTRPETSSRIPNNYLSVTNASVKEFNKIIDGKIAVPVLVQYSTTSPTILHPEISDYTILHHPSRNRTIYMKKPIILSTSGPFTQRPPKYLNQTTVRPYTVRHRLAKPTVSNVPVTVASVNDYKGKTRHPNIVAQTKYTTPRDSFNQETRYTKTKHDDKINSLEPTESIAPVSYSASPRPKMLYNNSQNYNPDQYDPYYAVYDEDGELYKDDYVQQYNTASLRPAVQQTYRGTPPSRRPVEAYTPRPVSSDDYDDALIQPQVNNQNQYQSAIRQSTRGEGNELGYDHNPSSVRTPVYEATPIGTIPSTTSTTTTTTTSTQRPTTAPFTEAMTPSRYTTRSPTDESPNVEPYSSPSPIDDSDSPISTTQPSVINFSTLAKPFEKTDNVHRLQETLSSTERLPTLQLSSVVTNNNKTNNLEVVSKPTQEGKKIVSLTSGFSIRRNPNNTNNPYTLTVLTRPFSEYNKSRSIFSERSYSKEQARKTESDIDDVNNGSTLRHLTSNSKISSSSTGILTKRKDLSPEIQNDDDDIPIYVRPTVKSTSASKLTTTPQKYYIKSIIKRPSPFHTRRGPSEESTEDGINPNILIDAGLRNVNNKESKPSQNINTPEINKKNFETWEKPLVSPYETLNKLRNKDNNNYNYENSYSSSTTSIKPIVISQEKSRQSPSYYAYRVINEDVPDQTTEVFSSTVKNVLKAFFDTFVSSSPKYKEVYPSATVKILTVPTEKVVNIGFQKKTSKYNDNLPPHSNIKRLQVMTEPTIKTFILSNDNIDRFKEKNIRVNDLSTTTTTTTTSSTDYPVVPPTMPAMLDSSTNNEYRYDNIPSRKMYDSSKFGSLITSTNKPDIEKSHKFYKIAIEEPSSERYDEDIFRGLNNTYSEPIKPTKTNLEIVTDAVNEIASTTSTTKSTVTVKLDRLTSTTKSLPFPTRASRVNPAIKLAATNPGGGRRSYQSSTKCSSDNSLQANPKCNEIRYQRPASTRGRGSAHYSTLNGGESPQPAPNRGTPPTRSRPTLKPSTAIVSKSTEFVDIYSHPPSRSAPVYPQPTPDKTAAKCRKDVCLLPDCYCGGKDIPGNLPVEEVPQIVLMTFDDAVNDLNKMYYEQLFEKGRVNPNGCPISATFYVSHEWTDYSQVQNLYADGHELGSHTISHSFGEQFSQKKWNREVGGQREILAAYGGVKLEDVRGMRAPFLSVGGNKMFKMLYDSNFTYDSSMPVYENRPPSWPYTLDYKLFHDCMIPPCPTKSYPGVWEVPMVMWQDLNGGRCSMGDACANPPDAEGVYKMILKNFDRHYTTNRAPFGLFYHAAWFTQPHHKEGFIMFLDFINQMQDVWIITNWQALQWVRDPTPVSRLNNFQPFQCNYPDRPKKCNNPKVCNLWHKSGVRYMRTCQPCPEVYPWTGKTGIRSSRIDNDNGE